MLVENMIMMKIRNKIQLDLSKTMAHLMTRLQCAKGMMKRYNFELDFSKNIFNLIARLMFQICALDACWESNYDDEKIYYWAELLENYISAGNKTNVPNMWCRI